VGIFGNDKGYQADDPIDDNAVVADLNQQQTYIDDVMPPQNGFNNQSVQQNDNFMQQPIQPSPQDMMQQGYRTAGPPTSISPSMNNNNEVAATPIIHNDAPATTSVPVSTPVTSTDLSSIKQQALRQLTPLVNQLDQTPEERFRTAMMLLQATDDQSLVKDAYEAAQAITDDKAKAQALLDVVNEINYFTQNQSK
jgi:hypothetical protein